MLFHFRKGDGNDPRIGGYFLSGFIQKDRTADRIRPRRGICNVTVECRIFLDRFSAGLGSGEGQMVFYVALYRFFQQDRIFLQDLHLLGGERQCDSGKDRRKQIFYHDFFPEIVKAATVLEMRGDAA